jgi:hypothetical protein
MKANVLTPHDWREMQQRSVARIRRAGDLRQVDRRTQNYRPHVGHERCAARKVIDGIDGHVGPIAPGAVMKMYGNFEAIAGALIYAHNLRLPA